MTRREAANETEPLAHAPLVLANEHVAELGEPVRTLLERAEDLLALLDRQRDGRPGIALAS
jgi:hypothetical protein